MFNQSCAYGKELPTTERTAIILASHMYAMSHAFHPSQFYLVMLRSKTVKFTNNSFPFLLTYFSSVQILILSLSPKTLKILSTFKARALLLHPYTIVHITTDSMTANSKCLLFCHFNPLWFH